MSLFTSNDTKTSLGMISSSSNGNKLLNDLSKTSMSYSLKLNKKDYDEYNDEDDKDTEHYNEENNEYEEDEEEDDEYLNKSKRICNEASFTNYPQTETCDDKKRLANGNFLSKKQQILNNKYNMTPTSGNNLNTRIYKSNDILEQESDTNRSNEQSNNNNQENDKLENVSKNIKNEEEESDEIKTLKILKTKTFNKNDELNGSFAEKGFRKSLLSKNLNSANNNSSLNDDIIIKTNNFNSNYVQKEAEQTNCYDNISNGDSNLDDEIENNQSDDIMEEANNVDVDYSDDENENNNEYINYSNHCKVIYLFLI